MLAELIEELTPRLLGGSNDDPAARERRRRLLTDLVQALRPSPAAGVPAAAHDVDAAPAELTALENDLYDQLEAAAVPVADLRRLARWFRERADHAWRRRAEERLRLLSRVSTLADSLDVESVLVKMARFSIPELADWCVADVVEDGRLLHHGQVAHRDPGKHARGQELKRHPPDLSNWDAARVVLSGQSVLMPELPPEARARLEYGARADIVRDLGGISGLMATPIVVLGRVIGLLTFMLERDNPRRYDARDLGLAEELARRVGQILENARLHEQLRQSEARFRVALTDSRTSVFEFDKELRVRWVYNSQLSSDPAQVIGKTAKDLFPPASADTLAELEKAVLTDGKRRSLAVDALFNGERRHLMVHYDALRDADGNIIGLTGSSVNMTEAKRVQDELAQALAFREQMMGVLGHDLRNPLSAVRGLAGLLLKRAALADPDREALRRIDQAGRRMDEMIGTLVDFTRSRFHGSLPIVRGEVDLAELCRGVVDELRASHPERELHLRASGDLVGQWDGARLAQVVSNLVGNALHHGTDDAPVEVRLSDAGSEVELEVSNRGPAIPAALVDRIFEPFRQGGGGEGGGGLGLGLYVVREIVRAHGGTVTVRSNDEATTFTVRLARTAQTA